MHYDPAMWNRHADNVCDDEAVKDAVLAAVDEHPELVLDEMMAAAHVERMVSVVLDNARTHDAVALSVLRDEGVVSTTNSR
ncbi:hypothetical protein I4F81_008040 [Pyropia yezoensis]|uniref:Uncharacterized protein n=1 Tax=Pyropia yezoensis TaxID=2788 RepID=A0ACC3C6B7_PYRYE|nr:hypothetical protein I4F81_008040 [Neopyropia yezoensis]